MMLDYGFPIGGVLGIIIFNKAISGKIPKNYKKNLILKTILDMLVISISAQLVIIPIMVVNFNRISILFWLSNVIASPLVAICIIGGFMLVLLSLILLPLAEFLGVGVKLLLNILIAITEQIANIPFANIKIIIMEYIMDWFGI